MDDACQRRFETAAYEYRLQNSPCLLHEARTYGLIYLSELPRGGHPFELWGSKDPEDSLSYMLESQA